MRLVKAKAVKYFVTAVVVAVSFWLYFQIDTYPYKVARWIQPYEAFVVNTFAQGCSTEFSWLKTLPEYAVQERGAYSVQAAFLSPDKHLETCNLGFKDKMFGEPIRDSHRYRYASTTKLITSAAIMRLKTQGLISLDDKLVSFLPELTEFKDVRVRQISIAHLLNHRAGFNRLSLNGDPMFLRQSKPWCPKNLDRLKTLTLGFAPGQNQVYSNEGYCLLGEVIRRVTGEPYRSYVERVFTLAARDIKFAGDYFDQDEVRYDYRYEEWYNETYLGLFDFDSLSSLAGLTGSAAALAGLLWDIKHHSSFPFVPPSPAQPCSFISNSRCVFNGVFQYQPEKNGMALYYHEGYLPGSSSIAVVDSYGGVTVLLRSGADKLQGSPSNEWIVWIYKQLNIHYTMQGVLPLLSALPEN